MATSLTACAAQIFSLALASVVLLQVASIGVFHQYRTRPGNDHFEFGWEMGRVGRSIAQGHGFSSPYEGNTGPTAWEPPLYPYLIGGVFKVFGIYTQASAWVLLSINSLFATLTCIPIFLIAHRTFGERVAVWSAYAWGLNPYIWYWSIHWIWDTTFTPLVLACMFLIALESAGAGPDACASGMAGWHCSARSMASARWPIPPCWRFFPSADCGSGGSATAAACRRSAASCSRPSSSLLVLSPWMVRNYEVFGRFVFLRDDFGLQVRLGNGPYADGMLMPYLQPNLNRLELEKFQQMGELAYARILQEAGLRLDPGASAALRRHQPETLLLLLERRARERRAACRRWTSAPRRFWQRRCWRSGDSDARCARSGQGPGFSRDWC